MDERKIQAAATITEFMGGLARRYNAETMKALWKTLVAMQNKFGQVYVADAIDKDPVDAELALFRYNQHLFRTEPEPDYDLSLIWERPIRWHHVQPIAKRHGRFRCWWESVKNTLFVVMVFGGVFLICFGGAAAFAYAFINGR